MNTSCKIQHHLHGYVCVDKAVPYEMVCEVSSRIEHNLTCVQKVATTTNSDGSHTMSVQCSVIGKKPVQYKMRVQQILNEFCEVFGVHAGVGRSRPMGVRGWCFRFHPVYE